MFVNIYNHNFDNLFETNFPRTVRFPSFVDLLRQNAYNIGMKRRSAKDEFFGEKLRLALLSVSFALVCVALSVFLVFWQAYGDNMFKLIGSKQSKADAYAASDDPHGGVVFFGDSLTEFCDLDEFYPGLDAINRGIAGDTTNGMLDRVRSNVVALEPSVVVFLGGANDLHHGGTPEQITENISQILSILAEETSAKIIVQSLYPLNPYTFPQYMNFVSDRKNEDVLAVNAALPEICESLGATFIDIHSLLKDKDGLLDARYTPDGLHVNATAYKIIADFLTPQLG